MQKALMTLKKDCKHSRVYESNVKEFPIDSVYVKRPYSNDKTSIIMTIEKVEEKSE